MDPSFLKRMFRSLIIWVLLLASPLPVFKYSHDLIAKKIAPVSNHAMAKSLLVIATSIIFLITESGSAFCFCLDPSKFLYPLNCSCKIKLVLPSWSSLGSLLLFALKVCATCAMVVVTDPSTKFPLFLLE